MSEPPHPVLLPSGEKGRSVTVATFLYRRCYPVLASSTAWIEICDHAEILSRNAMWESCTLRALPRLPASSPSTSLAAVIALPHALCPARDRFYGILPRMRTKH